MGRHTNRARTMTSTGNVPERPRRCLSGHQTKYSADHDAGRRVERTSVGAQGNYINGFSGTHLLAGDLGLRKTQYLSHAISSTRILDPIAAIRWKATATAQTFPQTMKGR